MTKDVFTCRLTFKIWLLGFLSPFFPLKSRAITNSSLLRHWWTLLPFCGWSQESYFVQEVAWCHIYNLQNLHLHSVSMGARHALLNVPGLLFECSSSWVISSHYSFPGYCTWASIMYVNSPEPLDSSGMPGRSGLTVVLSGNLMLQTVPVWCCRQCRLLSGIQTSETG